MDGQGNLETHLQHIHRREPCDDCGPAIDFALAAATETGGQVTRLREWLEARRTDEFDLSTDGTVVTGILTLLERRADRKAAEQYLPSGSTAESALRHLAFDLLHDDILGAWNLDDQAASALKPFGIDAKKIVDQVSPKPAPEKKQTAKTPAKKKAAT